MASKVAIMNRALIKLGENTILLDTDPVKPARVMSALYDTTLDAELRANRWKFAMMRTTMSALADAPTFGYAYQYELPADYLAMVQLGEFYVRTGIKQRSPWSVEGSRVLTDMGAPLAIRYIGRVTDTAKFDATFVEVLACRLALDACEPLTQSDTKYGRIADQYRRALSIAVNVNAIENPPDELPNGSWLDSRQGDNLNIGRPDGGYWPSGIEVL